MRRQNALTLISDFVEENDFSDTDYNSAYVSDVQSLIAKKYFATIRLKSFGARQKCLMRYGIYNKNALWKFCAIKCFVCTRQCSIASIFAGN